MLNLLKKLRNNESELVLNNLTVLVQSIKINVRCKTWWKWRNSSIFEWVNAREFELRYKIIM